LASKTARMRRCIDKAAELSRGTTVARKLAKLRDAMNRLLIVAILLISIAPLYAQRQQQDVAKLKADAQRVVSIISGDKAKAQTYCQINNLVDQIGEAEKDQDTEKAGELTQKRTELEKNLGPEYLALGESLKNMDLTSKAAQVIVSTFDKLDQSCPH
jgi:hypothetical protein